MQKLQIDNLDEVALDAWKKGWGDALTATKLLRDATGLSLREAAALIEKTAAKVGGRYNLISISGAGASQLLADIAEQAAREREQDPHIAAHRAARGVRKIRGAK